MAVFVDSLAYYGNRPKPYRGAGPWWCHLVADTVPELHAFAEKLGLHRDWFQNQRHPHYDLTWARRHQAIRAGAGRITTRDWIKRCRSRK